MVLPSSAGPLRCSRMVPTLGSSIGRRPDSGTVCERYPASLAWRSQPLYLRVGRRGPAERPGRGGAAFHAGGDPIASGIVFAGVLNPPVACAQLEREVT